MAKLKTVSLSSRVHASILQNIAIFSETFSLRSLSVVNKNRDIPIDDLMRERRILLHGKFEANLACIHDSPVLDERLCGDIVDL